MSPSTPEAGRPARRTVVIVDDHPMLRRGLASLINAEPDLAVCAEAATLQAAVEAIREQQPDLVIVDIGLEGRDGLELVRDMNAHHPGIPALVLSMHDEAAYGERCLRAGARGFVSKQQLDDTVLLAIRRLLDGEIYMSDALKTRMAERYLGGDAAVTGSPLEQLTDRQLQVFRLVGEGRSTRQIAEVLMLSIKTVESHLENIKHKLTLDSATALAQYATQWVESERTRASTG